MSGTTAFWYASRATGVVALLLLTAVLVLGILVNRQGRLPGLPRFAVTSLHRNISLLAVAFIAVHVLTAVADTFVSIPLLSSVIPFASGYERFWLGLGAISFDLMLALIITSLVRGRLQPDPVARHSPARLPVLAGRVRAQHRVEHRHAATAGCSTWPSAVPRPWRPRSSGGWPARPASSPGRPGSPPSCVSTAPTGRRRPSRCGPTRTPKAPERLSR